MHEAMKTEQIHFSMDAMEALGRSAAGQLEVNLNEKPNERLTKDSPGAGSGNIFKKIRDPSS